MSRVVLDKVRKSYGHVETVHGIDLDIGEGEFVVLVGPSGCGKSTTLRMIAGLETISGGEIRINDARINDLQPGERDVAMVFQNYALYPHLSVADNITFGLKLRKTPREEIRRRLQATAEILEIAPLLNRKPRQLSGGQRQRVAMGRAIIRSPSVFLFDEPLSNLDAKLRVQMRTEIKQLHARIPTTTVYVTHDQVEAMTLADRVVVMNDGRIEQIAPPQELYLNPATRFVAGFIGAPGTNFLRGDLRRDADRLLVRIGEWNLELPPSMSDACRDHLGQEVTIGIRPEHFSIASDEASSNVVKAKVDVVEPLGMETLVHFKLAQTAMVARLLPDPRIGINAVLPLVVDVQRLHLFDLRLNVLIC
jgi:multiple sugar transport system ATP-binding protein